MRLQNEKAPATDKESGLPKKYFSSKQSDSTKDKRAAHFKKKAKMDDDNPKAYEPAPGDATAKTKPSKYTKKYKQMFGENLQTLPSGKFGLSRRDMPQIKSTYVPDYLAFLKDQGIRVRHLAVAVSKLTNTQKELDPQKIQDLATGLRPDALAKPVIVSKDMFILDGHHRLNALLNIDPSYKVKVYQVDLPIADLIDVTKTYPKVRYKELTEKAPNTEDAMKRYKDGDAGFSDIVHLKAKGLIPRADGSKRKSKKYQESFLGVDIVELAEEMDCPPATQDLELNTKNRNKAIEADYIQYGPLNVDEPGDYWQKIAKFWDTTEEAAKKSNCGNCVAFDISERMKDCMPGETSDEDGELGYCWMHHFKCHSARSCRTWAKGGPITEDEDSFEWQERAFSKNTDEQAFTPAKNKFVSETLEQLLDEKTSSKTIKAIKNKAKETGIDYKILKKVFDRGVAAWRTGHRPGTTPVQWGLARINSFATGGKTQKTADKDLWAKHKGKANEQQDLPIPEVGSTETAVNFRKTTPGQPKRILSFKEYLKTR